MTAGNVGFTGTRRGLTHQQRETLVKMLERVPFTAYHGDCLGADAEFHWLVRQHCPDAKIETLPGDQPDMRANCEADFVHDPQPMLVRNAAIVALSDIMIACPAQRKELKRGSGTWATIRLAKKSRKPLFIIWPDGKFD